MNLLSILFRRRCPEPSPVPDAAERVSRHAADLIELVRAVQAQIHPPPEGNGNERR